MNLKPERSSPAKTAVGAARRRAGMLTRWSAPLAVLLATVLLALGGLDRDAMVWGDDIIFHSKATHGFATALSEGVIYPRWLADVNQGFGAPVFIFYPPLGYYLLGGAELLLGDHFRALWFMPLPVLFLTGVSFWLSLRRHLSPPGVALGAALYVLLPYHVLDLFWRFAWGEVVAFVWLPPLFVGTIELIERPRWRSWFMLVGASTALLLTHLATATILPVVLGPLALFHLVRTRRWTSIATIAGAGVVAFLCASVFLVPFMLRMDEVHLEWSRGETYDWRRHLVFRDETAFGYEADETKPVVNRAVASTGLLALTAVPLVWWTRRRGTESGHQSGLEQRGSVQAPILNAWVVAGITLWTVVLQTALASPVWELLTFMHVVQFPWRFAVYQGLMTALLCGLAVTPLRPGGQRLVGLVVLAAAAVPALAVSWNVLPDDPSFTRRATENAEYRAQAIVEYIPRAVPSWGWLRRVQEVPRAYLADGQLEVLEWRTHRRRLLLHSNRSQVLAVRTFWFAGWKAWLDGEEVQLGDGPRIDVQVNPGEQVLELAFVPTWDRRLGAGLSLLGLLTVLGLAIVARRKPSVERRVREPAEQMG
jgi:hypothetical protein